MTDFATALMNMPKGMTVDEGMGVMNGPQYVPPQVDVGQAIGDYAKSGAATNDPIADSHANPNLYDQMGPSGGNTQPTYAAPNSPYDDRVVGRSDEDVNQLNYDASKGATDPNISEMEDRGVNAATQLQKLRNRMANLDQYGHWEGNKFVQDDYGVNAQHFGNTPQGMASRAAFAKVISGQASKEEKMKFVDMYLSQGL